MAITTWNNEKNNKITNDNNINDISDESPIQKFYNKTNIFITGGTGEDYIFYDQLWMFQKFSFLRFYG